MIMTGLTLAARQALIEEGDGQDCVQMSGERAAGNQ